MLLMIHLMSRRGFFNSKVKVVCRLFCDRPTLQISLETVIDLLLSPIRDLTISFMASSFLRQRDTDDGLTSLSKKAENEIAFWPSGSWTTMIQEYSLFCRIVHCVKPMMSPLSLVQQTLRTVPVGSSIYCDFIRTFVLFILTVLTVLT